MLDGGSVIGANPWLVKKNVNCLLSPDSDGFLCGLLMSHFLDWKIVGFYDGKVMAIKHGIAPSSCAFLDIEINRPCVGSIGHHIISANNRIQPVTNFSFPNCVQPNELRSIDGKDFQRKYPFGTSHLLIALLYQAGVLKGLGHRSTTPLLFTDGVWNNVFGYTENCLEWLEWFGIHENGHPLAAMFKHPTSIHQVMTDLNEFLRLRDGFNAIGVFRDGEYAAGGRNKRTGDKLRLSSSSGEPINLDRQNGQYRVHPTERTRIEGFIATLGELVEWTYSAPSWTWTGLDIVAFEKGTLSTVTNRSFTDLFANNPISLAMTSGREIEYTLDPDNLF